MRFLRAVAESAVLACFPKAEAQSQTGSMLHVDLSIRLSTGEATPVSPRRRKTRTNFLNPA